MCLRRKFCSRVQYYEQLLFIQAVQQQKLQKQATTTSHFFLTQPQIGTYRGGSLPNVNQMSNNSVDLQVNNFLLYRVIYIGFKICQ